MKKEQFVEHVIRSLVLEYRISIETAGKLFGEDPNELYYRIININDSYLKNALIYVLDYETKIPGIVDQSKSKIKAMKFLSEFFKCKTVKEKVEMVNKINSNDEIIKLKNRNTDDYTAEEYEKILNYRYKYALSRTRISKEFGINERTICRRDSKLVGDDKIKFKLLSEYHDPAHGTTYASTNSRKR